MVTAMAKMSCKELPRTLKALRRTVDPSQKLHRQGGPYRPGGGQLASSSILACHGSFTSSPGAKETSRDGYGYGQDERQRPWPRSTATYKRPKSFSEPMYAKPRAWGSATASKLAA